MCPCVLQEWIMQRKLGRLYLCSNQDSDVISILSDNRSHRKKGRAAILYVHPNYREQKIDKITCYLNFTWKKCFSIVSTLMFETQI